MATPTHEITVRPRIIWTGVAVALVGMLDTGVMMVLPVSLAWIIVGVVIIAAGLGLTWFGGVMGDVHGGAGVGTELTATGDGRQHAGVRPGARTGDTDALRDARATTRRTDEQLDEATQLTRAPDSLLTTASLGLVAVSAWLMVSPWLFGFSLDDGAAAVILDQAIAAIVVGLCGLYAHQVAANLAAGGLAAVVGIAVVADGLFRHTLTPVYDVNQVVVGVLMLAGAAVIVKVARTS